MNRLDTSQIVDPNKLQPLLGPSIEFLQNATKEVAGGAAEASIGDSYSNTVGYALRGCKQASASLVNSGFIYFNGEVYNFTGTNTYNTFVNTGVFVLVTTNPSPDPITFSDASVGNVHNVRKLSLVDQVNGTGLFNFSDIVYAQNSLVRANVKMATKIIDIGDWNMDSTDTISVAHGLTGANIRGVRVTIRDNANAAFSDLSIPQVNSTSDFPQHEGIYNWGAANVSMRRRIGGIYDGTNYDSTGFNRGWIVVEYTL